MQNRMNIPINGQIYLAAFRSKSNCFKHFHDMRRPHWDSK